MIHSRIFINLAPASWSPQFGGRDLELGVAKKKYLYIHMEMRWLRWKLGWGRAREKTVTVKREKQGGYFCLRIGEKQGTAVQQHVIIWINKGYAESITNIFIMRIKSSNHWLDYRSRNEKVLNCCCIFGLAKVT